LCERKDYQAAWRRLRLQEEIAFGKHVAPRGALESCWHPIPPVDTDGKQTTAPFGAH
jgi:hypothetical protein